MQYFRIGWFNKVFEELFEYVYISIDRKLEKCIIAI